jgi:glycosyltransferase involved in cell wall biosynthesis
MRILHLIHSEGLYGAESILLYLAREQQRRGHEPLIGSIRDPGTAQTAFEVLAISRGLPVVPIRIAPRPTPAVVRTLLQTVRAHAPAVLHSHGYKANILLGPLPRKQRGPMLTTLHGWTNTRRFTRMWLYEYLDRLALRRLDAVVVVTRRMLQLRALQKVAAPRRFVIENGIPPLAERLNDLTAQGVAALPVDLVEFATCRPTLVAIGRLSAEKGFEMLLEAFAAARGQTGLQHQLLLAGAGPLRELLQRRIGMLGLNQSVRLAGYVAGADRLLGHAAGFVMSSLTEGMPLVLLEAMQWRVPILATSVGAIPQLLENGLRGRLVVANDLAALTQGLQDLMARAPEAPGGAVASAHRAVTEYYSSTRMADEYLSLYGEIA